MVTGSHIPFDRNGLKFYRPEGEITKADEAGIAAARPGARRAAGRRGHSRSTSRRPMSPAASTSSRPAASEACAWASTSTAPPGATFSSRCWRGSAPRWCRSGRAKSSCRSTPRRSRRRSRGRIAAWVGELRLDALVSTDGDGDRPLVADEAGAVLRGDALGILAARFARRRRGGGAGQRQQRARAQRLVRAGAPHPDRLAVRGRGGRRRSPPRRALAVGFEANGGFLLAGTAERDGRRLSPLPTRDALVPMLAVLAEARRRGEPLSALVASLPARATASARLEQVAGGRFP